ncbi:MAG TPA: hypothetical protein VG944_16520 [Fimbriimonas sp.]|nr:hypothetical protein [Fimbriimonas sp.]
MDELTKQELRDLHRQGDDMRQRLNMMKTKLSGHQGVREGFLPDAEAKIAEIVAELGRLLDAVGL